MCGKREHIDIYVNVDTVKLLVEVYPQALFVVTKYVGHKEDYDIVFKPHLQLIAMPWMARRSLIGALQLLESGGLQVDTRPTYSTRKTRDMYVWGRVHIRG